MFPYIIYLYVTQTQQAQLLFATLNADKAWIDFRLPIFGPEIPATLVHWLRNS